MAHKKNDSYEDIIYLPHHRSAVHPPLGQAERAAQFSPFAALSGYEEMVNETAHQVAEKVLSEILHEPLPPDSQ